MEVAPRRWANLVIVVFLAAQLGLVVRSSLQLRFFGHG